MNKYLTELIGTFFLVLTITITISTGSNFSALGIGSILMVMVYMGGHISGAHYNPAVTLGVLMRGKIETGEAIKYMVAQVAGGLLGALGTGWLHNTAWAPAPTYVGVAPALVAEMIFTFAHVLVVLNTTTVDETKGNSYYGLAIGFTLMAGVIAVGRMGSGVFNPAVGLSTTIVNVVFSEGSFGNIWIYLVGPFVGGALAAVVFKVQHS